jgi:hypothetical protein
VLCKLVIKRKLVVLLQILTLLPMAWMGIFRFHEGWYQQCVLAGFRRRWHEAESAPNDLKYFPLWLSIEFVVGAGGAGQGQN